MTTREEIEAEIFDEIEEDMPLEMALELASLWSAGKMVGGDAHAAAITLFNALVSLMPDNTR